MDYLKALEQAVADGVGVVLNPVDCNCYWSSDFNVFVKDTFPLIHQTDLEIKQGQFWKVGCISYAEVEILGKYIVIANAYIRLFPHTEAKEKALRMVLRRVDLELKADKVAIVNREFSDQVLLNVAKEELKTELILI